MCRPHHLRHHSCVLIHSGKNCLCSKLVCYLQNAQNNTFYCAYLSLVIILLFYTPILYHADIFIPYTLVNWRFHDLIGGIHVPVDDGVDKLNRKYTLLVFLFLALPIFTKQYIGDPIECFTPTYFTEPQARYVNSYCWTASTYYLVAADADDEDYDIVGQVGKNQVCPSMHSDIALPSTQSFVCIYKYMSNHPSVRQSFGTYIYVTFSFSRCTSFSSFPFHLSPLHFLSLILLHQYFSFLSLSFLYFPSSFTNSISSSIVLLTRTPWDGIGYPFYSVLNWLRDPNVVSLTPGTFCYPFHPNNCSFRSLAQTHTHSLSHTGYGCKCMLHITSLYVFFFNLIQE